jgi:hypothetical protein
MTLREAVAEVMADDEVRSLYSKGLAAADVLHEIRVKHGKDAFALCSVLDVCDELEALYG